MLFKRMGIDEIAVMSHCVRFVAVVYDKWLGIGEAVHVARMADMWDNIELEIDLEQGLPSVLDPCLCGH